jgi:hypothetical protein
VTTSTPLSVTVPVSPCTPLSATFRKYAIAGLAAKTSVSTRGSPFVRVIVTGPTTQLAHGDAASEVTARGAGDGRLVADVGSIASEQAPRASVAATRTAARRRNGDVRRVLGMAGSG